MARGKRLSDHIRRLHEKGEIADRLWWSAERFRDDWSLVAANGLGAMQCASSQNGGGSRNWLPGDAILSALRRLRRVMSGLDRVQRQILILLVVESLPFAMAAKAIRCAKHKLAEILRVTLEKMSDFYAKSAVLPDH